MTTTITADTIVIAVFSICEDELIMIYEDSDIILAEDGDIVVCEDLTPI